MIIITTISIISISFLVWLSRRFLSFRICPICAGVFTTWIWLVIVYFLGYQIDLTIPALLMGGSVVGLASQLEKKLPARSVWRTSLLWKILFIPAGFIAAYGLLIKEWLVFSVAIVFLFWVSFLFLSLKDKQDSDKKTIEKLKQKMDNCC